MRCCQDQESTGIHRSLISSMYHWTPSAPNIQLVSFALLKVSVYLLSNVVISRLFYYCIIILLLYMWIMVQCQKNNETNPTWWCSLLCPKKNKDVQFSGIHTAKINPVNPQILKLEPVKCFNHVWFCTWNMIKAAIKIVALFFKIQNNRLIVY